MACILGAALISATGCLPPLSADGDVTKAALEEAVRTDMVIAVVRVERVREERGLLDGQRYVRYFFQPLRVLRERQKRPGTLRKLSQAKWIVHCPDDWLTRVRDPLVPGHAYLVICTYIKWPALEYRREVSGVDDPFVRQSEAILAANRRGSAGGGPIE